MANLDKRFGFKPVRHKNGAPYNGAANPYYIAEAYSTVALFIGDPVILNGSSNTAELNGYQAGTLADIARATAGSGAYTQGVIVGFDVNRNDLSLTYRVNSTERMAWVADDPDLVFEVQEDDSGTVLTAAAVGLNADFIFTHAGSAVTGSGCELGTSTTPATTNTYQLRILGLADRPDNALGEFAVWDVMFNLHQQRYLTGT